MESTVNGPAAPASVTDKYIWELLSPYSAIDKQSAIMKELELRGSPYEIGFGHGSQAIEEVHGSLRFYKNYFQETSGLDWEKVTSLIDDFLPFLESNCEHLLREMEGLADGANLPVKDIIALNVRTELAFGLFKDGKDADGCTSIAYVPPSGYAGQTSTLLGQTWDWLRPQRDNLVVLRITPTNGKPKMHFISEGGIIGKIGFNEHGVGVCLNAIRARGVAPKKYPIHLALRTALECKTAEEAIELLSNVGSASAAHILVAGPNIARSLEFSFDGVQVLLPDSRGILAHTNHYIAEHEGIYAPKWLEDSTPRYTRALELSDQAVKSDDLDTLIDHIFTDIKGSPTGICQLGTDSKSLETVFAIAMDCNHRRAKAVIGQPVHPVKKIDLSFV